MKQFSLILLFPILIFSACTDSKEDDCYVIDLEKSIPSIYYSQFADSVSYVTLDTKDTCIMSGIDRIYQVDDRFFVKDNQRAGVLLFDRKGYFLKQLNYYGNGAHEFTRIHSFSVDREAQQICIYDGNMGKILKYNYEGIYSGSVKVANIVRDFAVLGSNDYLFIMPSYRREIPYGVWCTDSLNRITKELLSHVPKDYEFEFLFTQYNHLSDRICYYDRNWDVLYEVDRDTAIVLSRFNLKQAFPAELKRKSEPSFQELQGHAMMANFSVSPIYRLFTYYTFGEHSFKWVLFTQGSQTPLVSDRLVNDIDSVQSSQESVFYLNDSTWCRMLDPSESDCNITLQLLHIKKR